MTGSDLPLVSVIMNCYNSAAYLKEALDSVLDQTYANWEIIFWDNRSTDSSVEIYKSYDDARFKYHRAQEHTSLSTARNLAVEKASGKYIAFLDCDDMWAPSKLQLQVKAIETSTAAGFVYSDFDLVLNSTHPSAIDLYNAFAKIMCPPHASQNIYRRLLKGNFIIFSSVLIRTDLYRKIGGISDQLSHNEDYEMLLKASLLSDAICLKEKLLIYRVHGSNNSHANEQIGLEENRMIFNSLPVDSDVKKAIYNNEARYILYKLRYGKPVSAGQLFQPRIILGLIRVIKRKIGKKLFSDHKVR